MSKRDQILAATLELVSEVGFHATSVSLIIKKSGVAAGTIYHHFKNKEDLIDTLYSELKKEMGKAIVQNINEQLNYKEKFFLIWTNLFTFYLDNPKKFDFLEDYANSPFVKKEIKEINQRHYQSAVDFIISGLEMGILRNLPTDFLINLIFGNVSTLVRMIIMEEIQLSEKLLENAIQSSWDSVKIN
jgi:AcrR family transcriptional regulator